MSLEEQAGLDADKTAETEAAEQTGGERDYEAEARDLGWRPAEEFPGDQKHFVDAKTFVERGEKMLPMVKKELAKTRDELAELKRSLKKASKHFEAAEQRGYERAMKDLEAKHEEAVETGDLAGAKAIVKEMRDLKPEKIEQDDEPAFDIAAFKKKFDDWTEQSDWYMVDKDRTAYADLVAGNLGPAAEYKDGPDAWLAEIDRRVNVKFAPKKASPVNGGGNRPAPSGGGKTFADLPPEAKKLCDKWVAQGILPNRDAYVKTFDWS